MCKFHILTSACNFRFGGFGGFNSQQVNRRFLTKPFHDFWWWEQHSVCDRVVIVLVATKYFGKEMSLTITQSAVHKTLIVIMESLVRLEGPQLCPPVSLDWNIPLLQRAYNFFDTHPNSHRAAWKEENASWLPAIHLATQQKWNVGLCNQRIYNILFQWPRKEAVAALCLNTPLRGEKRVSYPWVEFVPFLCPQKCACHVSSSTL